MRPPAPLLDELVAAAQAEQAAARAVMAARQVLGEAGRRLTAVVAQLQEESVPATVASRWRRCSRWPAPRPPSR